MLAILKWKRYSTRSQRSSRWRSVLLKRTSRNTCKKVVLVYRWWCSGSRRAGWRHGQHRRRRLGARGRCRPAANRRRPTSTLHWARAPHSASSTRLHRHTVTWPPPRSHELARDIQWHQPYRLSDTCVRHNHQCIRDCMNIFEYTSTCTFRFSLFHNLI